MLEVRLELLTIESTAVQIINPDEIREGTLHEDECVSAY
jgi:hypothetical protein